MVTKTWWEALLKVVVMTATMCSDIIVAKNDGPVWAEGHGRGTKENGVLGRINRAGTAQSYCM